MLIEIKGKLSSSDLRKVIDILEAYFKRHGIDNFVEVDIDLKPFSKAIQMPTSLSDSQGKEIRSLNITKTKSGELKLKEGALDNAWMSFPLGSISPGELMWRIWPLYVLVFGVFILISWYFR